MSIDEIRGLTLADIEVLSRAKVLSTADKMQMISLQAFQNAAIRSTDKRGKPIYKHFEDFFDYKKALKALERQANPEDEEADENRKKMAEMAKAYNLGVVASERKEGEE